MVADTLSRLIEEIICPEDFLGFSTTEFESQEYLDLIKTVNENSERFPDIKIENGLVFRRNNSKADKELDEFEWKLWIPENLTTTLIREAHEPENKSHGWIRKTLNHLNLKFYWPNMTVHVKNCISNCRVCKEYKSSNEHMMPGIG